MRMVTALLEYLIPSFWLNATDGEIGATNGPGDY